jgi:peptidoglycan hydrolase CwlO-like protein
MIRPLREIDNAPNLSSLHIRPFGARGSDRCTYAKIGITNDSTRKITVTQAIALVVSSLIFPAAIVLALTSQRYRNLWNRAFFGKEVVMLKENPTKLELGLPLLKQAETPPLSPRKEQVPVVPVLAPRRPLSKEEREEVERNERILSGVQKRLARLTEELAVLNAAGTEDEQKLIELQKQIDTKAQEKKDLETEAYWDLDFLLYGEALDSKGRASYAFQLNAAGIEEVPTIRANKQRHQREYDALRKPITPLIEELQQLTNKRDGFQRTQKGKKEAIQAKTKEVEAAQAEIRGHEQAIARILTPSES